MSQEQQQIFPYLQRLLNGAPVEWKPLGEVATLQRGKTITRKSSVEGDYPVISGGQQPAYYIDQFNRTGETITVAGSGAYAGFLMYWKEPIFVSDAFSIKPKQENILLRYIYYFLLNIQDKIYQLKTGSGVPHVYAKDVARFVIPIPPMEVQERIVEILDKFTELQAELQAELALRKKQYIYFRDQLLSKDKTERPIRWTPLGKVGSVCMCKRILKNQTSETSGIPFYKIGTFGGTPNAYISKELFVRYKAQYSYPNKGDILLSASGTIGRTVIYDGEDAYFQDSNIVWIDHNEETVLNKYLYYCYQIADWRVSKGGTIARLYNKNLLDTTIPIPFPDDKNRSLEEQERIVGILDRFETMVHSIKEGLPREIELRRKQYEYFRDQLLTFPKG